MPVKEKERAFVLTRIFVVQFPNQLRAEGDKWIVRSRRFARIRQVAQKRKINIGIMVSQVSYFQVLHQPSHLLFIQQQSRNGYHGCAIGRNRICEVELWENLRTQDGSDQKIN